MKITTDELKQKYQTMSNKELCKELDISNPTLIYYLKKFNIPLKGKGNRNLKSKIEIV